MDAKEGNPNCNHEWVFDNVVICTNPPIYHKICKLCGRVEHEFGVAVDYSEFGDFYEKFHGEGI